MAQTEAAKNRLPRGTKPVAGAFFTALDALPSAQHAAVARAAQVLIRDGLRARREKAKIAAAKMKGRPAKSSAG